jgi:serine/threonine protein phosphatase 1
MIWAIGDIHGMLDPLTRLISKIIWFHNQTEYQLEKIIFLGDYIDHGPSSKQVVDYLTDLPYEKVFLMGNHEDLLLQFINQSDLFQRFGNVWFRGNGGQRTAVSFNPSLCIGNHEEKLNPDELALEEKYVNFFQNLKLSHIETIGSRKFAFVHGLLNKDFPVSEQLAIKNYDEYHAWLNKNNVWIEDSLLWDRTNPKDHFDDYILVHGHLPTHRLDRMWNKIDGYDISSELPFLKFKTRPGEEHKSKFYEFQSEYRFNADIDDMIAINVDTGAVYGHSLTAIGFSEEDMENHFFTVFKVTVGKGYRMKNDFNSLQIHYGVQIH